MTYFSEQIRLRYSKLSWPVFHVQPVEIPEVQTTVKINCNGTRVLKYYRSFRLKPPLFIDDTSRKLFFLNVGNQRALGNRSDDTFYGEVYMAKNGTLDMKLDCGYKSKIEWLHTKRKVQQNHWFPVLIPVVVPDGNTFQHFLDGTLPKIVQVLPYLHKYSAKVLIRTPRDKIIYEMLKKLNISSSQLVFQDSDPFYGADLLIYPCITPPVHPVLWKEAREAIGAPSRLQIPRKHSYIVLVTRKGCFNCGRLILNRDSLIKMLTDRYGEKRVQVFESNLTLEETVHLFGHAAIIMGPHGGGMYNVNFAPAETVVIEFMPTFDDGKMGAASDGIIWTMAQMLDQEYWRICVKPEDRNNMRVDLELLSKLLNEVDKKLEF